MSWDAGIPALLRAAPCKEQRWEWCGPWPNLPPIPLALFSLPLPGAHQRPPAMMPCLYHWLKTSWDPTVVTPAEGTVWTCDAPGH